MKVTNPTITTLTVTWNPADGNVQGYKVIYVPVDGGLEVVVRTDGCPAGVGVLSGQTRPINSAQLI